MPRSRWTRAGDCGKALEHAAERSYELVLLDLKMTGVAGLDALAALREAIPAAPLVVLSGEDNPGVVPETSTVT